MQPPVYKNKFLKEEYSAESENQEKDLIHFWDTEMPDHIADVYMPVCRIMNTENKQMYLAEYRMDESRVIIVCASGEEAENLRAEADVMDLLVLTCIPRKLGFFEENGQCILVREYIVGESLNGALLRLGTFSEEDVRKLAEDICRLLTELQERHLSISEKSLSAQNILMTPEGKMKLVEPEGIAYCEDCELSWDANSVAIAKMMNRLLTGNEEWNPNNRMISVPMRKTISSCLRGEYKTIPMFVRALNSGAPGMVEKRRKATGVVAAAAALALIVMAIPVLRVNRQSLEESGNGTAVASYENNVPAETPLQDATPAEEGLEDIIIEDIIIPAGSVLPEAQEEAELTGTPSPTVAPVQTDAE